MVCGHGGSLWQAVGSGWAKDDTGQAYYTVKLPAGIAQALLIEGDSYGVAVVDEKVQRAFQSTYRRVPDPNHFVNARESGRPCFLVVEGEKAPTKAQGTGSGAGRGGGAGRRGRRRGAVGTGAERQPSRAAKPGDSGHGLCIFATPSPCTGRLMC